jgi:hypothetical protein
MRALLAALIALTVLALVLGQWWFVVLNVAIGIVLYRRLRYDTRAPAHRGDPAAEPDTRRKKGGAVELALNLTYRNTDEGTMVFEVNLMDGSGKEVASARDPVRGLTVDEAMAGIAFDLENYLRAT